MNILSSSLPARSLAIALTAGLAACGGSSSSNDDQLPTIPDIPDTNELVVPSTYTFENLGGESTVNYAGQTKRQVLLSDLVDRMLDVEADSEATAQSVIDDLNFLFDFQGGPALEETSSSFSIGNNIFEATVTEPFAQLNYGDLGNGKNLSGKIAGPSGDGYHELNNRFFGWTDSLEDKLEPQPTDLVNHFFDLIAQRATDGERVSVKIGDGTELLPEEDVTITATGLDLRQLVQKFLLGAVNFSQGTADYLSIDFGSAENLALEGDNTYTAGQHDFDEAFGYFGAARDYGNYTDAQIKEDVFRDTDGDGKIALSSEYNFGNSTNCAKRDIGSGDVTDFTGDVFQAFLAGRTILQAAGDSGELTVEQETELNGHINTAALTWEKCIAATVIHYINDVVDHLSEEDGFIDTVNNSFTSIEDFKTYAKHWSEMKGFALGLQFSPFSPFANGNSQFDADTLKEDILEAMGDAPVLADGSQNGVAPAVSPAEARATYRTALENALDTLVTAYDFDAMVAAGW